MILIQSDNNDYSTNGVIDWVKYLGGEVCRFNGIDIIKNVSYCKKEIRFTFTNVIGKEICINIGDLSSYWYRRGGWSIWKPTLNSGNHAAIETINEFYSFERRGLSDFINYFSQNRIINKIGNESDNILNKLKVLECAEMVGLHIPDTIISTRKSDILEFYNKHNGKIITKAIVQAPIIRLEKSAIFAYTSLFTKSDIKSCPICFFPTLFQKAIEKKFELRIFFLRGKFYSTAIFSQKDEKTKNDFRNYNFLKPNRTPPILLPFAIRKKLGKLMKILKLSSGSIDMIYSTDNEFIFLEVNPIGQFNQVSHPGNFYLERLIAKVLCA